MKKGLVYLFTGDGKGKTSAALGTALRASLFGQKVAWIAWYKSPDWDIAEKNMIDLLPSLDCYFMGKGFFIKKNPKSETQNPKQIQNSNDQKSNQIQNTK